MTDAAPRDGQRVVAVTGGGGGIGAAIATRLGREGAFVLTIDPLVSLDGSERLQAPDETTADRIVASGGSARASSVSVTDRDGVRAAFEDLGRLDAVVNVAGISRPTSFARGEEVDWQQVLEVHLDGYLNVLAGALPLMAEAGHGRILGVTSGAGWRPADAGAYSCAKRAVAALTWQLGRATPPGVAVNALSPIAMTRMVAAALGRAPAAGAGDRSRRATGGLSLGSMPEPEELAPMGARLVADDLIGCNGAVLFAGGSEVGVVSEPGLLEAFRLDDTIRAAAVLDAVTTGALIEAEARQASTGGSNPRFGDAYDRAPAPVPGGAITRCAVAVDDADRAAAVTAALEARGVATTSIDLSGATGFAGTAAALAAACPVDAVVVALAGRAPAGGSTPGWQQILAEHDDLVGHLHADAAWARAVADHAKGIGQPIRLVTLTDAASTGGRSRAQAAAQLARAARGATDDRVSAFAVSVEGGAPPVVGEIAAHLACRPEAAGLAGAELVAGAGWFGLRSHPRLAGSLTLGGAELPEWFDATLRELVAARTGPS